MLIIVFIGPKSTKLVNPLALLLPISDNLLRPSLFILELQSSYILLRLSPSALRSFIIGGIRFDSIAGPRGATPIIATGIRASLTKNSAVAITKHPAATPRSDRSDPMLSNASLQLSLAFFTVSSIWV